MLLGYSKKADLRCSELLWAVSSAQAFACASFGSSRNYPGALLEQSWASLGPVLGLSWAISALSWTCLGPFWACLGPSWAYLGRSWPCLGPVWSHLGALVGHPGAILSPLGPKPENDPQKYEKRVPGINDFGDDFKVILGSFLGPFLGSLFEPFLDKF